MLKPFWGSTDGRGSTDGPALRPVCAHSVLTMRPLSVQTVLGFNRRWAHSGPTMPPLCDAPYWQDMGFNRWATVGPLCYAAMCPRCAHRAPPNVFTMFWASADGPTLCAQYALTMHPLCVENILGLNTCTHSGATMCPLCSHYAPAMCLSRAGLRPMGEQ